MKNKKKTIKCLDKIGRIVIPKDMREKFEIIENDPIEIFVDKNSIILRKNKPTCIFCENTTNLVNFKEKLICENCKNNLSELLEKNFSK